MLDQMQVASGFVPVNLSAANNTGCWVNLKLYARVLVVFFKAAAASGTEDPTVNLQQATDVSGSNAKALNISRSFTKTATDLTTIGQFTAGSPSSNSLTVSGAATKAAIWVIEVLVSDLDRNNGFCCIQASVPKPGSISQLGGILYVFGDARQADTPVLNPSALT
jgi:hypothetical protein